MPTETTAPTYDDFSSLASEKNALGWIRAIYQIHGMLRAADVTKLVHLTAEVARLKSLNSELRSDYTAKCAELAHTRAELAALIESQAEPPSAGATKRQGFSIGGMIDPTGFVVTDPYGAMQREITKLEGELAAARDTIHRELPMMDERIRRILAKIDNRNRRSLGDIVRDRFDTLLDGLAMWVATMSEKP